MLSDAPYHQRSWLQKQWYHVVRATTVAYLAVVCGIRASGRRRVPGDGSSILMANHASFYDTMVLGVVQVRNIDFVARSGLFFPGMKQFLRSVGAFPIQRDGGGAAGIKEMLKRLKQQSMVGLFPEGTRTPDGAMIPLKGGVANVARKARCQVLCVGIAGAFEAWPRHQPWPGGYPLQVQYAELITPEELATLDEESALKLMEERLRAAHADALEKNRELRHYLIF